MLYVNYIFKKKDKEMAQSTMMSGGGPTIR